MNKVRQEKEANTASQYLAGGERIGCCVVFRSCEMELWLTGEQQE